MSDHQVDTRALRAHLHELRDMHFDIDEGDDSLYAHGGVDGGIYPVESLLRRNKEAIVAIVNAAPELLDAADERDALRARVGELQAEVERVRGALDAINGCPRFDDHTCDVCRSSVKLALAPRAEVKP